MKLPGCRTTWAATVFMTLLTGPILGQQRVIAPEDYYHLQSASSPRISPNGKSVVYVVNSIDQKQGTRHREIWIVDVKGGHEPRQLTHAVQSSSSPQWAPDGSAIAFLTARPASPDDKDAKDQVHILALDGGEVRSITSLKNGVKAFRWSPDGTRLVCVSTWGLGDEVPDKPDRNDSRHYTHSAYKFDTVGFFDDQRKHLWVVDVSSGSARQITEGDDWNDTDPEWSPDGTRISFVSDRSREFWENSDSNTSALWIVPATGGAPLKVSQGNGVVDAPHRWSPDGRWIAYFGSKAADEPPRLFLAPSAAGSHSIELTSDLDESVANLQWGEQGRAIYFLSEIRGETHFFRADAHSGEITQVSSGPRFLDDIDVNLQSGLVALTASDFQHPSDVSIARLDGTQETQLTHLNQALFRDISVQPVERMTYKSEDGWSIDGFLVKPAGWQVGKKYPMILYIHGGPEGMFGTNWMILPQVLAAQGWAVFYTNPRGSTGYGTKFMRGAVREWGGSDLYRYHQWR